MTRLKRCLFGIHLFLLGSYSHGVGQNNSYKLPAVNIIGVQSMDHFTGNPSTTVNTCANAFDGDLNTFFLSYQSSGGWVGLDLGEKHIITGVEYCAYKDLTQRLLLGIFEGANKPDFGDAVPLCLIKQTPPEDKMTAQTVDCSRGFRYVRYVGPIGQHCTIAELAFYGYKGNGNDNKLYQTTNLPDIIIHTNHSADIVSKKDYVKGIVSFISENGTKIYTDSLDIRGRGNASWDYFPKKPYRMKLYHKTNVLGLPAKEKNWTLISNFGDKTLMRNLLAFDLSKRLQMPYTPVGVPVNVYLNSEFKGCYQLCDQIEVAAKRVDITKMTPDDVVLPNISGGYCIEMNAYYFKKDKYFFSQQGIPVTFKYPKTDEINSVQFNYIQNHFNLLEAAVFSSNYKDPANGYKKYLDLETFIRFFLVGEITGNTDTYWQTYLYKKRNNDKFFFGPVWDFDIAYENDDRTYPINNNHDWVCTSMGSFADVTFRFMVDRLLNDEEFVNQMKSIYAYYRNRNLITEEALLAVVDRYANELEASQKLNFIRWDILNEWVHQNPVIYGTYAGEVEHVKKYIKERISWMDQKLGYTLSSIEEPGKEEIYFKDVTVMASYGNIRIEGIDAFTLVEIFDVSGKNLFSKAAYSDLSIPFQKGIYLIRLTNRQGNTKVVKCNL